MVILSIEKKQLSLRATEKALANTLGPSWPSWV